MTEIIWTDYLKFKVKLRGFSLENIKDIVRYSNERYYDTSTDRWVVVGKDSNILVIIPHEISEDSTITPITVHATTRQQINYRIKSGRFKK